MDNDTCQLNQDDLRLVDTLIINHNLPVGEESMRQNYTGIYNFLSMDLTITAVCADNFTDANCTQCVPGLTGALCDVKIDSDNNFSNPSFVLTSAGPPHQPTDQ